MAGRKRNVLVRFYVTPEEKESIKKNVQKSRMPSTSEFVRRVAINRAFISVEHKNLKELNFEINKIDTNINQIIRRVNQTENAYKDDLEEIKKQMERIWKNQRTLLLRHVKTMQKLNGEFEEESD